MSTTAIFRCVLSVVRTTTFDDVFALTVHIEMNTWQEPIFVQLLVDRFHISLVLLKIKLTILHGGLPYQTEFFMQSLGALPHTDALLDPPSAVIKLVRSEIGLTVSSRVLRGDRVC
jgi:hypothetical protein